MPASLSQLVRNHARLVLDFGAGASLTIDYRPLRITPRQMHRFQGIETSTPYEQLTPAEKAERIELADEQMRLLADCLINWDLLDAQGQPIPPTLDGLQDVDFDAQAIIMAAIINDQQVEKKATTLPVASAANGHAPTALLSTPTSPALDLPLATPSPPYPTGTGI